MKAISHNQEVRSDHPEVSRAIHLILRETVKRNRELGIHLFISAHTQYPQLQIYGDPLLFLMERSAEDALSLWEKLQQWQHPKSTLSKNYFFKWLPDAFVNAYYSEACIRFVSSLSTPVEFYFTVGRKYLEYDPQFCHKILSACLQKWEMGIKMKLSRDFFMLAIESGTDYTLLEKAYLSQIRMGNRYDYKQEVLEQLCRYHPLFFVAYVKQLLNDTEEKEDYYDGELSFVWQSPYSYEVIKEVLALYEQSNLLIFGSKIDKGTILWSVFNQSDPEDQRKVEAFLLQYVRQNCRSCSLINQVLKIARTATNCFDKVLLEYVKHNNDVEQFQKINVITSFMMVSGNVSVNKVLAERWKEIRKILDCCPNPLSIWEISSYVNNEIRFHTERIEAEYEEMFKEGR